MARTVISCIVITCILSVTQWDAGTLLYGKPPHKQQKTLLQSIGQTQIRVDEEDLPKSFYKFSLNKFIDTYKKGVPEKLYLQLDKPYYCAGETIWFKGYLLNAVTLSYPRPTRFIYVELVDKRDSVRRADQGNRKLERFSQQPQPAAKSSFGPLPAARLHTMDAERR